MTTWISCTEEEFVKWINTLETEFIETRGVTICEPPCTIYYDTRKKYLKEGSIVGKKVRYDLYSENDAPPYNKQPARYYKNGEYK